MMGGIRLTPNTFETIINYYAHAVQWIQIEQLMNRFIGCINHWPDRCSAVIIVINTIHRTGQVQHKNSIRRQRFVAGDTLGGGQRGERHQEVFLVVLHRDALEFGCAGHTGGDGLVRPHRTHVFRRIDVGAKQFLPAVQGFGVSRAGIEGTRLLDLGHRAAHQTTQKHQRRQHGYQPFHHDHHLVYMYAVYAADRPRNRKIYGHQSPNGDKDARYIISQNKIPVNGNGW